MTEPLLAFFKALAHESRLKIRGLPAQGERSVQELPTLLDFKEPTVSHHLAILKAQGLVSARAEGTTRWHRLDVDMLEGLSRRVLEPGAAAGPESWDAKVLRGFIDADGRLTIIPASRRKRRVVLRWLMTNCESGRRYPEAEVNAIIQDKHWDSATLRRELIGHRMLARENGFYWRLPDAGWNEGVAAV